jgi:ubiquinone/menaquinone biosynthesis C-methylase UbiE
MATKENVWYEEIFPHWRSLFDIMPAKDSKAFANFVIKKLNLKKDSKFLDCPIGIGRIALPLAKKGIKITGIDITLEYLAELKEKSDKLGLPMTLLHCDMKKIDFENEFDAVGNLWTSFGYFEKESDNLLCLKKMFKALKPGGKLMMQTISRDWIIKNFSSSDFTKQDDLIILEERKFNFVTSRNDAVYTFLKDGKEMKFDVSLRMYSLHELIGMFKKVGFVDIESFGSIKETPIDLMTRDMIVIGSKPKK